MSGTTQDTTAAGTPRVVVGVDGSDESRPVLAWAMDEARRRGAELEVVLAWEAPALVGADAFGGLPLGDLELAAEATVKDLVLEVGSGAGVPVIPTVATAAPAGALLAAAQHADLLVVGSRGRGQLRGLLFGSVSQQCVTHAHGPVAVVPITAGDHRADTVDTLDHDGGRVVVGVDGSAGGDHALRWAIEEARLRSTHVVAVLAYSFLAPYGPEGEMDVQPGYSQADAEEALHAIVSRVVGDGIGVDIVERAVCDLAPNALHAEVTVPDVLVVGARGLGGFKGLLLGSTGLKVLGHAPCPVVVVRPPAAADER